jgi:hypothetical protein
MIRTRGPERFRHRSAPYLPLCAGVAAGVVACVGAPERAILARLTTVAPW